MILSFKETPKNSHADKFAQLQVSQHDPLFLADLPKIPQSPVSSGRGCKEYRRSPALKFK